MGHLAQPLVPSPHLVPDSADLNQNQRDHDHKVTTEKPVEEKDREKDAYTRVPLERQNTQNEEVAHQEPPPLTAAAKELINDIIRSFTKKTYKSKVGVFDAYCTKEGTNTKSCHPNVVINFLTMLPLDKGLSYQAICGYSSAIAGQNVGVGGISLGLLPEIKLLARAIFIDRPPPPR